MNKNKFDEKTQIFTFEQWESFNEEDWNVKMNGEAKMPKHEYIAAPA